MIQYALKAKNVRTVKKINNMCCHDVHYDDDVDDGIVLKTDRNIENDPETQEGEKSC